MDTRKKLMNMELVDRANEENMKEYKRMKKNNKLNGLLINVSTGDPVRMTIDNTLDELYRILCCDCIETTTCRVGSVDYLVICDEQGKLKGEQRISGLRFSGSNLIDFFVGNIFVISPEVDADGDMVGLTNSAIDYLVDRGLICFNGRMILSFNA